MGIPHPPGTPLYVMLGHVWLGISTPVISAARAMNLLSALATAAAGGITAGLVARETSVRDGARWGAIAGALCAGLMATAWANATETEVYALALLHAILLLAAATRAGEEQPGERRWLLCAAYLMALAPALHLSVLVAGPSAVMLASRRPTGEWRPERALQLGGSLVLAAGIGRVSWLLCAAGVTTVFAAGLLAAPGGDRRQRFRTGAAVVACGAIGASVLLFMLVRARHDPALNQGNPSTLQALTDVISRRQYQVAPLFPRQAPVWLQLAAIAQYADWQVALGWGRGIYTSPARVLAAAAFIALLASGAVAMRRDTRRVGDAMLVLLASGTLGVAAYLNLKAGASLGWGLLAPGATHEARERDYFFVLGFWAWGCMAGYGAMALLRARGRRAAWSLGVVLLPLSGNWLAADRSREPDAGAPRRLALALLGGSPRGAVLFSGGDNDSYPLWYAQQVEGVRRDILVVTLPLLPADWYDDELRRRTGGRWSDVDVVPGARLLSEQRAGLVARWAGETRRPVVASPAVTAAERALLGARWRLVGPVYVADGVADGVVRPATVDVPAAVRWAARGPVSPRARSASPDDVAGVMTSLLDCSRLGLPGAAGAPNRDSLELRCNLR